MWYYISTNWIGKQSPTSRPCPIQSNCLDRVGVGKSNNTTFGLYVEGYDPSFVCDEFCIRILEIVSENPPQPRTKQNAKEPKYQGCSLGA